MSFRSSAGPATERMPTPSSSRMMCARLVLPSPGGPTSRTWSSASPRPFAASSAIASCSLMRGLADELVEPARPEALLDLLLVVTQRRRQELRGRVHAAFFNASRTRSSGGRSASTSASARSASSSDQPSSTSASRATTWCSPEPSVTGDEVRVAELLLQLEHDPLGRLLADAGNRLEARGVPAHDRAAQLGGRRAGDDRERDLRPDRR